MALEAVFANKVRSMLTALGIIFGVAAVISMMAIGKGAQKEILDQMKLVGVNNIIISPISTKEKKSESNTESAGKQLKEKFSPGLSLKDAEALLNVIPTVAKVSPEVSYDVQVVKDGKSMSTRLTGVSNHFFKIFSLTLEKGAYFSNLEQVDGKPVCIIGSGIKARLFPQIDPVGRKVKCGNIWLTVIGVIQNVAVSEKSSESLGINDYNSVVFTPLRTVFVRFKDRSVVNKSNLGEGEAFYGGDYVVFNSEGNKEAGFNQLDKITVQVKESTQLNATAEVIRRMLTRKHSGVEDFDVKVPELLLKQEQRTKDIFNIVLGAIASISLLVGGIGIMNIMLASVMERIREIGVRMAIGARKRDIVLQFLTEATLISVTGGLIGILLGIILSKMIMRFADILTIISMFSVLVSFGVSVAVGVVFGFMPAKKASQQDPVTSLRYE
ncbi:MAG TPA: hypothetical protein DEO70_13215 [Bacteroidales bacterium]|nr:MAG: hypothetical protein A2X11_06055 [Bacteroidetes bacterium GWE2_42_24]OFY31343.1 MAG: hypothetical protein A2X09_01135 [Bacteroidetes bacterium GWF2_43_11]HBZ67787.1 hypothetical protein [Bacteroidales bacterium]